MNVYYIFPGKRNHKAMFMRSTRADISVWSVVGTFAVILLDDVVSNLSKTPASLKGCILLTHLKISGFVSRIAVKQDGEIT